MIIIEVIYSILCAVLPCTIYFTARKRKGYHLSILAMLIFVLYLWKVYDLTGAGGLTNIFYAPKGGDNTSIIQANINLIPFNIIEKTFYLNILMLVPSLRNTAPFNKYPNAILNVNTRLKGTINDLNIQNLELSGLD